MMIDTESLADNLARNGITVRKVRATREPHIVYLDVLGLVSVQLRSDEQTATVERLTSPARCSVECWPTCALNDAPTIASYLRDAINKSLGNV